MARLVSVLTIPFEVITSAIGSSLLPASVGFEICDCMDPPNDRQLASLYELFINDVVRPLAPIPVFGVSRGTRGPVNKRSHLLQREASSVAFIHDTLSYFVDPHTTSLCAFSTWTLPAASSSNLLV